MYVFSIYCISSSSYGGGVYVGGTNAATFEMKGGTISGNTASSTGGGVYVYTKASFTMSGGTIGGTSADDANTATNGGGVAVGGGTFEMSDGTISGNTASSYGGGVYVYSGTFTMNDGTISGNTANSNGGGVYFYSGTFTVSGTPVVTGNKLAAGTTNNVYLPSGMYITLSGPLTDGASVGVTTETAPTKTAAVEITTAEDGTAYYSDSRSYFSSDNTEYYMSANSTGSYLELGLRTALTQADFTVNTEDEPYTGSAITKTINSALVVDTDYTVSYSANKNAGTATITITGIGAYSGTLNYAFTISERTVTPSISGNTTKTYDGTAAAEGLSIELEGVVTGEDVSASAKSYTYDSAAVGTDKTITASGITLGGTAAGNYALSSDTATTNGTITTKGISTSDFTVDTTDETYTGSAIEKTITSSLTKGTDYTVTYDGNTNAGTATITITGTGNYSGTLTYNFTIKPITLTASINGTTTKTYDATTDVTDAQGLTIELDGVVGSDDVTASAASYTYNSANVDEATTITASGIILTGEDAGNYTLESDSVTTNGVINTRTLSTSDFTVDTDEVTYTGSAITNKTITTTLSADDFTYSFSNNTNAGTATITITGKGNCTGSVSYDFIIHKATPTVSLTGVESKTYDGTAVVEPTVSVTLVDNTMYTQNVTYFSVADDGTETELTDAPSAAGNYKVVVTVDAGSNYNTTSVEASFEIFKAEQEVKIEGFADVTYDGQAHEVTVTADDNATVTVTYKDADGNEVAAPVNAGTYTAHVTVTRDNYVTVEHDVGVSIALATQDVTVEGFSVTYDGQAHEVTVTADDDATVTVTYTDADGNEVEAPVNAGTYTAHVTVTQDNYATVEQVVVFTIDQAAQDISYETTSVTVTEGDDSFTIPLTLTAVGEEITYTSSDESVATVDANGKVT
ncbi:MAG: YDG domain-containing protein, partial [Clostridiales bacterium]|nr:YDG domain-containing protein [Clostridiales bacterium]